MRIAQRHGARTPSGQKLTFAGLLAVGALALLIYARLGGPAAPFDAAPPQATAPHRTPSGQSKTQGMIAALQQGIQRDPSNVKASALLGATYLQYVRETGDPTYYAKAEAIFAGAYKRDPQHIETLIGMGTLALARHEFRAALTLGEQARALAPDLARTYGVIADAQIELGMYDEAVQTVQTMVDLRPDLSSYSRVSYLRELYGDLPGAAEAMGRAVAAGGTNAENTQWVAVQLGHLAYNQANLAAAERHYAQALAWLPEYVHAQAGLARVRAAQGRYGEAIELYTRAVERMPIPEYVIALGDVYAKQGNREQADRQYGLVQAISTLHASNGVNTDLEMALFFADHNIELPGSLSRARAAYAARPSIHAADVLGWTLYKLGNLEEAQRYAKEALRLGTRDALKLFHAGMIASALGHNAEARIHLQAAVSLNPHFSLIQSDLAVATLRQLNPQNR